MNIHVRINTYIDIDVYISLFLYLSIYLSIYISSCLSTCPSISLYMCRRPRSRDWSCLFNAKMESIKLCKQKKAARTCCPRAGFKPGTLVLMNLFDKSRPHILQIVIGDPDLLSSDTTWGRLVRYCVDNGAYVCDPKPSLKKKATQTRQIFKRK